MSPPAKELMKLTLEQHQAHSGHPIKDRFSIVETRLSAIDMVKKATCYIRLK